MSAAALAAFLQPFLHYRRWWIAYSGGLDSHVLLHALADLRQREKTPALTALHINHQLNPLANEWSAHCERVCAQLGIEFIAEKVAVINNGDGLEAAARRARYAAFEHHVNADELLLQAHHCDDQIETLLLRLLRGSGIAGLAAMPAQRELGQGILLRPLLQWRRADLQTYAQQHQLRWIEDDSNYNDRFDRNFLRLNILPLLAQRWPAYPDTLTRVVAQAREATLLIGELAQQDLQSMDVVDGTLPIADCIDLSATRLRNLLRYWIQQQHLSQPSREQLQQVVAMLTARADAQPCVSWPGAELHRFRDRLFAMPPLPPLPSHAIDIEWNCTQPLRIDGMGELSATTAIGTGLRSDLSYRVRNRHGGERCRPIGRAHSQTLKKLLQEYAVPSWLRDRLPIIYCGDQLAAVADLWVCDGFQPPPSESGWVIDWNATPLISN
ncbi:MAG TPA: tRNA lysidine(34) synthetase TilS [Spongiibacteraceae bacterium]